jgi:hypothetical protein
MCNGILYQLSKVKSGLKDLQKARLIKEVSSHELSSSRFSRVRVIELAED